MKRDDEAIGISQSGRVAPRRGVPSGDHGCERRAAMLRLLRAAALAISLGVLLAGCAGAPPRGTLSSPRAEQALDAWREAEASRRQAQEAEDRAWSELLSACGRARSTHEALGVPEMQAWEEAVSATDDAMSAERRAKREWLVAASLALGQHPPSAPEDDQ